MSQRANLLRLSALYGAGCALAAQGMRDAFAAEHPWLALLCAAGAGLTFILLQRNIHCLRELQGGTP